MIEKAKSEKADDFDTESNASIAVSAISVPLLMDKNRRTKKAYRSERGAYRNLT